MEIDFLKSNELGTFELNEARRIRNEVTNRWDKIHMLEGLKGPMKTNIATLFENEAKMMLSEATDSQNSGQFTTVVFPIVRRVFSKLLANEIVSVQAMNLPVGKLFFILPVTSERDWYHAENGKPVGVEDKLDDVVGAHKGLNGYTRVDRRNGNEYNRFYLPDEALGVMEFEVTVDGVKQAGTMRGSYDQVLAQATAINPDAKVQIRQVKPAVTKYMAKSLYDLFYNDFLFDNSKGKIHIKTAVPTPVAFSNGVLVPVEVDNLPKYADGKIGNCILKVTGFSSFNAGKLTGPDGNEMDTEAFLVSLKVFSTEKIGGAEAADTCFEAYEAIPYRLVTQKYGKGIVEYADACDAEGALYIDIDLRKPVKKQGASIDGYLGVDTFDPAKLQVAWCQYDSLELETEMGEVSFKLESVTVSVEERKLKASWSPELAQDVSAFHNIDAESEITALLSEQIAAEIDREILRDLRHFAPWKGRFDVNGWRRMAAYSTNYTQKDWNQELVTLVNQISAQIHKSTLRGGASFAVVSSEISALFDNLEFFHVSDASAESDQYNLGIERIGSLQNRYQIYRDPQSPAWSIIIGHKGKSLLDTGYIYAPYIPMQLTPLVINPNNFAPVKAIMTRYAKKCVNNRFYGGIQVDGLRTWDINELR